MANQRARPVRGTSVGELALLPPALGRERRVAKDADASAGGPRRMLAKRMERRQRARAMMPFADIATENNEKSVFSSPPPTLAIGCRRDMHDTSGRYSCRLGMHKSSLLLAALVVASSVLACRRLSGCRRERYYSRSAASASASASSSGRAASKREHMSRTSIVSNCLRLVDIKSITGRAALRVTVAAQSCGGQLLA